MVKSARSCLPTPSTPPKMTKKNWIFFLSKGNLPPIGFRALYTWLTKKKKCCILVSSTSITIYKTILINSHSSKKLVHLVSSIKFINNLIIFLKISLSIIWIYNLSLFTLSYTSPNLIEKRKSIS